MVGPGRTPPRSAADGPESQSGKRPVGEGVPAPWLEVRREGELAVVSYRFGEPAAGAGEPARFVAAPFAADDEAQRRHPFAVEATAGELALSGREREWRGVRVAATSERGVAGETSAATFGEWAKAEWDRAG